MKYLLLFLLSLFTPQAFAQININPEKPPSGLILYPKIYQVIVLEPMQDFQLSALHDLDYDLIVIEGVNKLEIFIVHDHYSTFQQKKDMLLDNLKTALNRTAAIISNQSYGREYLPSKYWKHTIQKKSILHVNFN